MHMAAWHGEKLTLFGAATMFAVLAAVAAARLPAGIRGAPGKGATARAVIEYTRISALVYGWGAAALLSIYRFAPLHWQHGWQYGSGMLLICAALVTYLLLLEREHSPLAQLSALDRVVTLGAAQGLAAAGGIAYIIFSGKLSSPKGDWAANAVFLAGGVAIAWISYLALITHRDLKRGAMRKELAS